MSHRSAPRKEQETPLQGGPQSHPGGQLAQALLFLLLRPWARQSVHIPPGELPQALPLLLPEVKDAPVP